MRKGQANPLVARAYFGDAFPHYGSLQGAKGTSFRDETEDGV